MAFSPREVAEQLTVIDAVLFKNVVPSEYLSSTWGKRTQPGHENVAPTVRATVVQFNRVANCVMTSCLGDPNMTAQGRAKVLERWIEVARECQALRNFSSLYAIVSALQSMPIYRLNKTWGKVSRWGGLSTGGPGGGGSSHVSAIALSSAGASWVAVSPGHRAWVGVQCP
nr:PREDICTED: ral guanine nucleotide dissociation stimulator-like [Equus przewalskii]